MSSLTVRYKNKEVDPLEIAKVELNMFIEHHKAYREVHKAEVNKDGFTLKLDWLEQVCDSIPEGFRRETTKHYTQMFKDWLSSGFIPGVDGALPHHPV